MKSKIENYIDVDTFIRSVGKQVADKLEKEDPKFSYSCTETRYHDGDITVELDISGPYSYFDSDSEYIDEVFIDYENKVFHVDSWYLDRMRDIANAISEKKYREQQEFEKLKEKNIQLAIKRLEENGYKVIKK